MCGIVGFIGPQHSQNCEDIIVSMTNSLIHRGPDDWGVWSHSELGIVFGHRRLSIIDLSPEGHQPMISAGGRYVITFNGEIYNFEFLRAELLNEGFTFRGRSDTEVMLAAFERWGVAPSIEKFTGMFAFAVLDLQERVLVLARDRLGEKPLYYGYHADTFLFASELKALTYYPHFDAQVNRAALVQFMEYGYVPSPLSIYQHIYKLSPGAFLKIPLDDLRQFAKHLSPYPDEVGAKYRPTKYWSLQEVYRAPVYEGSEEDAIQTLDSLLKQAVRGQMISDVPLGAFLSGGIDSSTIVSLMQAQSTKPIKTFSIGFHFEEFNEAHFAKNVAEHLGTDHTELYVSSEEAMDVIPNLATIYDEPLADSSQIPTFLVSQLARNHVKVSLSGDGGDEFWGGYPRFFWALKIWGRIQHMPLLLRHLFGSAMRGLDTSRWDTILKIFGGALPPLRRISNIGHKIYKLSRVIEAKSLEHLYHEIIVFWENARSLVQDGGEIQSVNSHRALEAKVATLMSSLMYLDAMNYLPDDILVKLDRASMAVSLESRAPLLDHHVVEFVSRLPLHFKVRRNVSKYLLRKLLYKYVPPHLVERPKMGFGVPLRHWLRGPLKDWCEDLLDEKRISREGYLDAQIVRKRWHEFLRGERNWEHLLWCVLMFESWLETGRTVRHDAGSPVHKMTAIANS